MAKLLILSNGHGEDLSGSILGKLLRISGQEVNAFPLVGNGQAYSDEGIKIIIKTKQYSTGGLGYTSLRGRLTELLQGQIFYLINNLIRLLKISQNYDLIIAIGDVIPVIAAWLSHRPTAVYLVAYSSHYEGKLRLPWPCKSCLSSKRILKIFSRDKLTSQDLTSQLNKPVSFSGNPFMEPLLQAQEKLPPCTIRLGLMPGSRIPELKENILMMLSVIEFLPKSLFQSTNLSLDMALVSSLKDSQLKSLTANKGWEFSNNQLTKKCKINIHRNSFIKVIQNSDLILSMAGTASEQAVGSCKPVLQLKGNGPQFTSAFAEAQRRLLGPTIFCADGSTGSNKNLKNTAKLIILLLEKSKFDSDLKKLCRQQAKERIGNSGCTLMVQEIINLIKT